MTEKIIRVLIADDHAIVRDGLSLILGTADDMVVVGAASDGQEALTMVEDLAPDVMLLDLRMPEMDGIAVMAQLAVSAAEVRVVVLTTYNEPDLMAAALQQGALGYLLKDTDRESLFTTIRAAAEGRSLLAPDVLAQVMQHLKEERQEETQPDPLTDRELEVLNAVAAGQRNKEIARHLGITERTVKAHLTHIFHKLAVDSRTSAVAVAVKKGLLDLEEDAPRSSLDI